VSARPPKKKIKKTQKKFGGLKNSPYLCNVSLKQQLKQQLKQWKKRNTDAVTKLRSIGYTITKYCATTYRR
jgi:hypothetical protein